LLEDLLQDDHPILLEGIHCTYLLSDERFNGRRIILRLHNVEYQYYRQLYQAEKSLIKKMYYLHESNLLKQYEQRIAGQVKILAVSEKDRMEYADGFGAKDIGLLPVFLPFGEVRGREGTGCFCLYHGNLSVSENEQVIAWLLKHVFCSLEVPLIISGKAPTARLTRLIARYPQVCLIADPSEEELQDLIAKAQVNVLPSFHCTGIKLKLLNALFNGRHCVVNEDAVEATGLASICHMADHADTIRSLITQLYTQPFTERDIRARREVLSGLYNNKANLEKLMGAIWQDA
jgi:glycosyltransferase involved in cell wall biosynthesis